MYLGKIVDKCVAGGVLFRVADQCAVSTNVEQVFKAFGVNAKHIIIGVYEKGCPKSLVWEDLADAGFTAGS